MSALSRYVVSAAKSLAIDVSAFSLFNVSVDKLDANELSPAILADTSVDTATSLLATSVDKLAATETSPEIRATSSKDTAAVLSTTSVDKSDAKDWSAAKRVDASADVAIDALVASSVIAPSNSPSIDW